MGLSLNTNFSPFLQDMFPYLEKYLVTDYLSKLVDRIEYIMKLDDNNVQNESKLQQDKSSLYTVVKHKFAS